MYMKKSKEKVLNQKVFLVNKMEENTSMNFVDNIFDDAIQKCKLTKKIESNNFQETKICKIKEENTEDEEEEKLEEKKEDNEDFVEKIKKETDEINDKSKIGDQYVLFKEKITYEKKEEIKEEKNTEIKEEKVEETKEEIKEEIKWIIVIFFYNNLVNTQEKCIFASLR